MKEMKPLKLGNKMREIQMEKKEEKKEIPLKAFNEEGAEIKEGTLITDFRGDIWVFLCVLADGKIYARTPKATNTHRIFFPSVFNLTVLEAK